MHGRRALTGAGTCTDRLVSKPTRADLREGGGLPGGQGRPPRTMISAAMHSAVLPTRRGRDLETPS